MIVRAKVRVRAAVARVRVRARVGVGAAVARVRVGLGSGLEPRSRGLVLEAHALDLHRGGARAELAPRL